MPMHVLAACCVLILTTAGPAMPVREQAAPVISVAELLDAYDAGRFEAVDTLIAGIPDLTQFSIDLQRAAVRWAKAAPPERVQRRRLVAAAVGLEAARAHVQARAPGRELVEWGGMLARAGPRTEAERVWYLAAIALAQWLSEPALPLIEDATRRFPAEDRFHLANAIAREQMSWRAVQIAPRLNSRNDGKGILRDLVKRFERLVARASISAEVHLRLGHTYLRLDQPKPALEHLDRVEPLAATDPFLRYLSHYLSGKAREAIKDAAGADAAYRRALALAPGAQSATFAAAALAFDRDARDEANALVESAIARRAPAADPWRSYQAADARFWPVFVAQLRKELR